MNVYPLLVEHLGIRSTLLSVVLGRALLIALIVLVSDEGFTTFAYLKL